MDEDRSIKTIHLRNEARLSLKEGGSQPLQKKLIDKVIQPTNSDEVSASSSSNEGSHSAAANGVEYSPSSSAKDSGQAPDATNGG